MIKKVVLIVCILIVCNLLQAQDAKMNAFIVKLMKQMTLEEKIGQLNLGSGSGGVANGQSGIDSMLSNGLISATGGFSLESIRKNQETAVNKSRLHIPLLFGLDVIHGYKTIFPIPLAISCMWDVDLIEKSARIAATEASANGICWTYSPMVDIARDPRWGRIAEGSGEDPWLGSRIAEAYVKGYQGEDLSKNNTILACVKHFALYGAAEAGRDYNTVDMSKLTMYNDYLPPYKAAFDAGAGSAMSSFNLVDGIPATGNKWLLTDLLRKQWGFKGFVVSDYNSIGEMIPHGMGDQKTVSIMALKAGLDMDMAANAYISTVKEALKKGKISMQDIDLSCKRILEAKYKLGLFDDPYRYMDESRIARDVLTDENLLSAREIAKRSIVLLKNNKQILPLKKASNIAVIGPLANNKQDLLGTWAFMGDLGKVVTIFEGIKNAVGNNGNVFYARGANFTEDSMLFKASAGFGFGQRIMDPVIPNKELIAAALDTAKKADVIVAVLGEPSAWSGEAASLSNINLSDCQKDLLKALLATGKPVILVLANGRPLTLTWEDANVPAMIEAWHGGIEAGNGLADVLFGDYNPSGKLTATFPRSVGQIPIYYNYKNTGRPFNEKDKFTSKYLDISNDPLYPFGYGLSYTIFQYGDIRVSKSELIANEKLIITIPITNIGKLEGEEVVQLYINDPVASISRPVKELKNYKKIMLQPGEKQDVTFTVTTEDLKFYNSNLKYDWESGEFIIYIGTNSADVKSTKVKWVK